MRGPQDRPAFTANLNAGRLITALLLAVLCWIVASPGIQWVWESVAERRLPLGAVHFDAVVLLAISWSVYLLWGERWGGPALGPLAGWRRLAPWLGGLLVVSLALWFLRDLPLVGRGLQPVPKDLAELLAQLALVLFFTEVVVRMGWLSIAAGITRSPVRAVALTALAVACVDLFTLPAELEMHWTWWAGIYVLTGLRELGLCAVAYTHGWSAAATIHVVLTLRWVVLWGAGTP